MKTVLRLGTPAVIENLIVSMVYLTDALLLAMLPNNSLYLASISVAYIIYWRLINLVGCTQIGSSAYIARRWGEGRYADAGFALGHALTISTILGFGAALLIWPFTTTLLRLLSHGDENVVSVGHDYITVLLLVLPVRLIVLTLNSGLRAAGDSTTPMAMMILMVASNLVLSYTLMFGGLGFGGLGFMGAPLGTALSYCIAALFGLSMFQRGLRPKLILKQRSSPANPYHSMDHDPLLRLNWMGVRPWFKEITPSIFRVSVNSLGEEILVTVGFLTYIGFIGSFGREALAAHSATVRIEALSYTAGWGIALATSAMVGQALGAGKIRLAEKLFALNTLLACTLMGIMGIFFILNAEWLLSFFKLDPHVMQIGVGLMIILGVEQIFMASGMTLSSGLRGAGDTFPPFVTQLAGIICMRLIMGYILAWPLGFGIYGLYWATVLDWMMRTAVYCYFIWRGGWKKIKI